MRVCLCVNACVFVCKCVYVFVCKRVCVCTHACACMCASVRAYMRVCETLHLDGTYCICMLFG